MSNTISNSNEPQFLLPKIPNLSKRTVSSVKSTGSSDSGAETSDSSDDKSIVDVVQCSNCNYITNELSFYVYHLKSAHNIETLQCMNCNTIFSVDNYQRHMTKCKGSFICEYCSASFAQKSYLQRHISRMHSKINVKYLCDICGQVLSSNNNLKQHKLLHLDSSQFVCEYCNKGFVQKVHYNTHLDSKHSKQELSHVPKPYICCVCSEQFMFHTSLQNHMNQYCCKKEKKYCCGICNKAFVYPSELRRHEHIHLDKYCRLYSCHYCDKKYNRVYQYIEHLFFHENISAFKCPKCGKVLSELSYLKKHYKRHFIKNSDEVMHSQSKNTVSTDSNLGDSTMMVDDEMLTNTIDEKFGNDEEYSVLLDRFIDEVWEMFHPYLDDQKSQSSISLEDLKLDVWEEFNDG